MLRARLAACKEKIAALEPAEGAAASPCLSFLETDAYAS